MRELEGMARQINDHRMKQGAVKEASTAYKQMMRGRYEYLNDFMEEMQVSFGAHQLILLLCTWRSPHTKASAFDCEPIRRQHLHAHVGYGGG